LSAYENNSGIFCAKLCGATRPHIRSNLHHRLPFETAADQGIVCLSDSRCGRNADQFRDRVLQIRLVRVAAPFDNQSFIYRTGPYSYERDPYAGFLAIPADVLRTALRAELKRSGAFKEVVPRGSGIQPDTIAEIYVSGLYGDFENKSSPAAVLQMSFTLFESRNGAPETVLLQKELTGRVPPQQRTAAALMAGWDETLKRVISALAGDLKAAKS